MYFKIIALHLALSSVTAQTSSMKKTAKTIREKSFDIISQLVKYDENIVLSPLSIVGGMYMLAAGSAGKSRREILETLNFAEFLNDGNINEPFQAYYDLISSFQSPSDDSYILKIANGMFHQMNMTKYSPNKVTPEYVDLLQKKFIKDITNIQSVNFQENNQEATEMINNWVNKETQGKIPQLFEESLNSETLVVLVSSLYFKASWAQEFEILPKESRKSQELCWATSTQNVLDNVCDDVQWMHKEEDVHSVELKMGNSHLATVIDLPMKHSRNSDEEKEINKWMMQIWLPEQIITTEEADKEFQELIKEKIHTVRREMKKATSNIIMPKFKIEFKSALLDSLKNLGINEVFSEKADLSPMLGTGQFAKVTGINHAVNFNVDEKGIEGAAVTSIQISSRTFHQPELLQINKPFYFVITNRCWNPSLTGAPCDFSNVPLFMGRVVHPQT